MDIPVEIETKIKIWFLSVVISLELRSTTSSVQFSQLVELKSELTLKLVTIREGITYPRAIPRDDPAIARALANAISFCHGF